MDRATDRDPRMRRRARERAAAEAAARRRRRLRWATGILTVLALGVIGLWFRLSAGPIYSETVGGMAASALAEVMPAGSTVVVGSVGLSVDETGGPLVEARDVRIALPATAEVSVDTIKVATSWATLAGFDRSFSTLVAGHLLIDANLDEPTLPPLPDLLPAIEAAVKDARADSIVVESLTLRRQMTDGRQLPIASKARLEATDEGDHLALSLADGAGPDPWRLSMTYGPGRDGADVLDLRTSRFDLADLAGLAGRETLGARGPVGLEAQLSVKDRAVAGLHTDLAFGPLMADREGGGDIIAESRLEADYDPARRLVIFTPSPIGLPGGPFVAGGRLTLDGENGRLPFSLQMRSPDGRGLAATADGAVDPAAAMIAIDRLRLEAGAVAATAAVRVGFSGGKLMAAVSAAAESLDIADIRAAWPAELLPAARAFVEANLLAGRIERLSVDMSVTGNAQTGDVSPVTVAVAGRFTDAAFPLFEGGPIVRGAAGKARLDHGRLDLDFTAGRIEVGRDLSIVADGAKVAIPDIAAAPPVLEASGTMRGSAGSAVAFWGYLPAGKSSPLPITPNDVSGDITASINLSLPLAAGSKLVYGGALNIADLALDKPFEGRRIADGDLKVVIADEMATITGKAKVDGVAADIDVRRPLSGTGAAGSTVTLVVSDEDRKRLGLDLGDAVVGPIEVTLASETTSAGEVTQKITADLTRARLLFMPIGYEKGEGREATATFTLRQKNGRTTIDDFVYTSASTRFAGRLVIDEDGLVEADFPTVKVLPRDALAISARRRDGALAITATGSRFDAKAMIRRQLRRAQKPGELPEMPVAVTVRIDEVLGFNDERLGGVNISATVAGGELADLVLSAATAGSGSVSLTLQRADAGRRLEIEVGEVGRLLRFADFYGKIAGGRARIAGLIDGEGRLTAAVDGYRWTIVDEPALVRFSTAAEAGPGAGQLTADIDRLLFDLVYRDGKLTIADGVVRGSTAGIALAGDVNLRRDRLDLSGTYLPASAFDSLLGKIPLIGDTVFAGGRAGLLGVSFRITGPIDQPDLTINPLSVVAPGIFRKLFELR